MTKKYKSIIYDWDGCLLKSLPVWIDGHESILRKAGIKVSTDEIVHSIGSKEGMKRLGHPKSTTATRDLIDYLHKNIGVTELYPNVQQTLETLLHKNIDVYIVSSAYRKVINITPAFDKIKKYIIHAVFADDVSKLKPNPQAINLLIKKYKINREDTLMIGDSEKDILAAQNAGIDVFWFAPKDNKTIHNFDYLKTLKPTRKIKDHAEILSYT